MVNRCVCFDTTLEKILKLALEKNYSFEQVLNTTNCGSKCGMCKPYIKKCLETGQTEFKATDPL